MSKIIEHTSNGFKWLLVEVPEGAKHIELQGESIFYRTIVQGFISPVGNRKWIYIPQGSWEIVGKADSLTEGQWKEIVPTVAGWKNPIYYNHTAKGSDYRDIVDAAFDTAKESGLSLLAKQGLNESTTLILKSTQLL